MNTQPVGYKVKAFGARKLAFLFLVILLLLPACARQPQPAGIEEITFQSGELTLVGELRTPAGTGPFPLVIFVHGDAQGANRTFFGMYLPIMERMLRAGYAVFSWDNPGAGESTGTTNRSQITQQQAQIVTDAIEVMKAHRDIDPGRIGLWGVSMAGYVIPRVLMVSEDVAFMICQSCGSMSGDDEFVFLTVAQGYCGGVPAEDADQLEILLADLDAARSFDTYEGYLRYRGVLDELAALGSVTVPHPVASEAAWLANDPTTEFEWSPMEVIAQVGIPVLAIWGERDTKIDPVRAAHAYRDALEQAGNSNYRVEVIRGADHTLAPSETGCVSEERQTVERVLEKQGFTLEDLDALDPQDPVQFTLASAWPYAPEYLDLIEEWLTNLP
ncbi:MAG TPA: alpha/beta fold hydrolase [Anaerolineae bacterium]|nr:alpha/beta fold hydrolase [Anaerolineae bacterium]